MQAGLYVYYRVSPASHDAARRAVSAMFGDLKASHGVAGRLACRRDDPDTWMEIYEGVSDVTAFGETLEQAARRHGIAEYLQASAGRVTEVFLPVSTTIADTDSRTAGLQGQE